MSNEIKIEYGEVETALSQLKAAIQSLESSFPASIGGSNQLTVVTKLNELNQSFQQMLEAYKTLLLNNEEATRTSVEEMREADLQLSSAIKSK